MVEGYELTCSGSRAHPLAVRLSVLAAIEMKVLTFKRVFRVHAFFELFVTLPRSPAPNQIVALDALPQVGKGIQAFLLPSVVVLELRFRLSLELLVSTFLGINSTQSRNCRRTL